MVPQPFTADGVTAKIWELQKLPDQALKMETQFMRTDFRAWMLSNFTLDDEQSLYLQKMDSRLLATLSTDLADCMDFRLPLYVTFGPKIPIGSKFVKPNRKDLVRWYDPIKGYVVGGHFSIEIVYEV